MYYHRNLIISYCIICGSHSTFEHLRPLRVQRFSTLPPSPSPYLEQKPTNTWLDISLVLASISRFIFQAQPCPPAALAGPRSRSSRPVGTFSIRLLWPSFPSISLTRYSRMCFPLCYLFNRQLLCSSLLPKSTFIY